MSAVKRPRDGECIDCEAVLTGWRVTGAFRCVKCSRPPPEPVGKCSACGVRVLEGQYHNLEKCGPGAHFVCLLCGRRTLECELRCHSAITADDVRTARLDCDAHGRVFDEVKLAVAAQVLRSIVREQPTASAVIKALAEAALERLK